MFRKWWKILIFKMIKISLWSTEMHMHLGQSRSSHRSCYLKVGVPKNLVIFTGNPFVEYILNKVVGVSSLLIQVFSYEYCEILKTTLKQFWRSSCVRLLLARHSNSICFFFLEKCLLPKPNFPSFRFLSVFSSRSWWSIKKSFS